MGRAQAPSVMTRLSRHGRMSRDAARELASTIHTRMIDNAASGGNRYDPMRQAVGGVMFDGPGANRAEYETRLRAVIGRLTQGLTEQNLEALFAPSDGAALRCAHAFEVTMAQCDALIAAASRQNADIPFLPADDGAALSRELTSAGMSAEAAGELVRELTATLLSVPASIDNSERGRRLTSLMAACPGSIPERASQVRAWHHGATSPLARCIGRAVGREGRAALGVMQSVFGVRPESARGFLRWAHGQSVRETPRGPTREELMSTAQQHYRGGRFADAARTYEQVIAMDASFAPAHQALAVSRMRAGNAPGAVDAYRTAARLLPRSAELQVGLARALVSSGDREGAIEAYRAALAIEPNRADAASELMRLDGSAEARILREQARAHFGARRFPQAEQAYRRLTELVPNEAAVHAGLGAALLAQRRATDAVAAYRRATELDANNAGFFYAFGAALEAANERSQALVAYRRVLTIAPTHERARAAVTRLTPAAPPPAAVAATPGEELPEIPSREALGRVLAPYLQQLEVCAPRLTGTVTFRIVIRGTDGRPLQIETLGESARTEEAACMEAQLGPARFPRFTRSEFEVQYPFELRGRQATQGAQGRGQSRRSH